eukprot:1943876-Rhodomonas_salina.4
MSGTDIESCALPGFLHGCGQLRAGPLSPYASAARCPVLTYCEVLCDAMPGTDVRVLRCYAMRGTDTAYGHPRATSIRTGMAGQRQV